MILLGAAGAVGLAAGLAFGPIVRSAVAREAARRHLELEVGGARPGWFAVRLVDVDVQPIGAPGIHLRADEVMVGVSALLRPTRVQLRGVRVTLVGTPDELREQSRAWRGEPRALSGDAARSVPVDVSDAAVHWDDPNGPDEGADLRGLSLSHDDRGTRLAFNDGQARFAGKAIALSHVGAEVDARGTVVRAHAGAVTLEWNGTLQTAKAAHAEPAPAAMSQPVLSARVSRGRHARPVAPSAEAAGEPILTLPNLYAVRAVAASIAALLADRIGQGADIGVDSLTCKIVQAGERVALTVGPGPLVLARSPSELELRYSTNPHGTGTPLGVRLVLPTNVADLVATVEGGPVSLALLGVQEGAAGLMDVDRANIAGRARVVLSGDGSTLTYDVSASAHALSLNQPRLALDPVRGLDVSVSARGEATAGGDIRVDDFAATLGALHVSGMATLEQRPDHVAAGARFDVSPTECQALLDSLPRALLPALQGTALAGTFGGRMRFAFDTRALDDLQLEYDIEDRCRLVQVPAALDHDRFVRPFEHRIYLPDGSTAERTTGPGTADWTPLDDVSPYMQTAVLTTEDGAFPRHHGYNHAAIRASIIANLKARRFVRGASTITMQLAKNLFLSRDKTLSRKLEEVVLTDYLEQTFSKDEIMELYLNVIEFGPSVYGITAAAEYYFGRAPAELDLAECLFLASLLPAPLRHAAMRNDDQPPEGWMRTLHSLMETERKRGLITDAELAEAESETIVFWHGGAHPAPRPPVSAHAPATGTDSDIPDPFETAPAPDSP
jgi:Transglycosylase